MAKKKPTKADIKRRREMLENAERTRQLALKAHAELEARRQVDGGLLHDAALTATPFAKMSDRERRQEMLRNAKRTRQLALKAQAELNRRKQQGA